ncbi:MAG: CBS domain-containing protein [Nitrosopumilus sp.]|nr:CBS domain-containing protein [Nitrosopumilus sp.]
MASHYVSDSGKSKIAISNFMTLNTKSVQSDASVKDAAKIMYENHIPSILVEERGKIIGIVTYADIALALAIYANEPASQIRAIMSTPVISVTSDSSILDAVELMLERKIHKLPVIDDGNVQGIISSTDVMSLLSVLNEEQFYDVFRSQISK